MFRIRSSQLSHFGVLARDGFEARMTGYFAETFPKETAHLELPDWVARNTRIALDKKLEKETDVAQYLLLCLRLGEDAPEKHPWFSATLKRRDLAPDGKLRVLVRTLNDQGIDDIERFIMKPFA